MADNSNDKAQKPKILENYEYDTLAHVSADLKKDPDKFDKHGTDGDVLVTVYEEVVQAEDLLLGENVILDTPNAKKLHIDRGFFKGASTSAQDVYLNGVLGLEDVKVTKAVNVALSDLSNLETVKVGGTLRSLVTDSTNTPKFNLQTDETEVDPTGMSATIVEAYRNNSTDMKHAGNQSNIVAESSTKPKFGK